MSSTEIRLLGSVEVVREDGAVPVRGSVPRALLARLAWTPSETVSTDRLVADVWAVPPDAAGGTLRAHVSRLRALALGPAIVGVAGGYPRLGYRGGAIDPGFAERTAQQTAAALGPARWPEASARGRTRSLEWVVAHLTG